MSLSEPVADQFDPVARHAVHDDVNVEVSGHGSSKRGVEALIGVSAQVTAPPRMGLGCSCCRQLLCFWTPLRGYGSAPDVAVERRV